MNAKTRTRKDRARKDRARKDRARKDRTRKDRARKDRTRKDRARKDRTRSRKTQKGGYSAQDLLDAVSTNNYDKVNKILEQEFNLLNKEDANGNTALHIACSKNFIDIVKLLIDYGIDTFVQNKNGKTAFDLAAENNSIEIVDYLLSEYVSISSYAAESAKANVFSRDVNKLIMDAIKEGHNINSGNYNNTGNYNSTDNNTGNNSVNGNNTGNNSVNGNNTGNNNFNGNNTVDNNTENNNDTAGNVEYSIQDFFNAVHTNNYANVKKIIKKKYNLRNKEDANGNTALHIACSKNFIDIVKLLIGYDIDTFVQNKNGKTAFDLAAENNFIDIVNYMLSEHVSISSYAAESAKANVFSREVNKLIMDAIKSGHYINNDNDDE